MKSQWRSLIMYAKIIPIYPSILFIGTICFVLNCKLKLIFQALLIE